ncbi:MAG: ABC transporter permease [Candidatus Cloacimonetes bacterium]|nr:ABC transporter permease [Candidatus Cloacimonadota bacterium]
MFNKKLGAVIKREYLTRVRTKGFIIGTLIFPFLMVLIFGGVWLFGRFFQPETKTYAIIDNSGVIYDDFVQSLPDTLKNGEPKFIFSEVTITGDQNDMIKELQADVNNKKIDGYLVIPEDILEVRQVTFSARNISDFEEQRDFERALSRIVANMRLEMKGYPAEEIRNEMNQGWIKLVSAQVTEKGEVSKNSVSNYLMTYLMSYFLMLFIMSYGQSVTRSVIEEKSQRITETIISSIKPSELMVGKLTGISLVGITQMAVFGFFLYLMASFGGPMLNSAGVRSGEFLEIISNLSLSIPVLLFFLFFFLLGYALYAALFAAIGAMVNTEDEGQQFLMPVILLNIVGFLIMISVAKNPDTAAAFWISLFPFFTPVVMFCRIAVSDPVMPSGAYLSIGIMIVSVYFLIKLVGKIYRVGILMYGKKPSLKETLKWLKY